MTDSQDDPKQLIAEAYRIEGITPGECRSIFLDWALSLPDAQDTSAAARRLHAQHARSSPNHPMTAILAEGRAARAIAAPRRRARDRADRRARPGDAGDDTGE